MLTRPRPIGIGLARSNLFLQMGSYALTPAEPSNWHLTTTTVTSS